MPIAAVLPFIAPAASVITAATTVGSKLFGGGDEAAAPKDPSGITDKGEDLLSKATGGIL